MSEYGVAQSEKKKLVRQGYAAHRAGLSIDDCPFPMGGTGSRSDFWCKGWWKREYEIDPDSPLHDPQAHVSEAEAQRRQVEKRVADGSLC